MSVQFVRVQSYGATAKKGSRSRTAGEILAEAKRVPENSGHVEKPRPPDVLFGDLDEIEAEVQRLSTEGKTEIVKDGKTQLRKLHANAPTLAAMVLSYPARTDALMAEWKLAAKKNESPESFRAFDHWKRLALDWLKAEWGDKFKAAVVHWDEGFPHIHAYGLATQRADGVVELAGLHCGRDADAERAPRPNETAKDAGKRRKAAYCKAMEALQDRYHEAVGGKCGQARLGPERRRMSRGEWKAEKLRLAKEASLALKVDSLQRKNAILESALNKALNPPKPERAFMAGARPRAPQPRT